MKLREELAICRAHPDKVLFLDIETTGLSHYYDEITVVGWSLGGRAGTYIKGDKPAELLSAASSATAMVTFNGIRFDQKFLKQEFQDIKFPSVHIDLMYLCRRVGLKGGQKSIEKQLGVELRDEIYGVDGFAAVLLWHKYLRGDKNALRTLIHYNRADIAAMGAIFDQTLKLLPVEPELFDDTTKFIDWSAPSRWRQIPKTKPPARRIRDSAPTFSRLFKNGTARARVVGIDLTGSEARPTGWCLLKGKRAETRLLSTDEEIIEASLTAQPNIVSIDSPLCLPRGRISVFDNDPGRDTYGIMRECERELKRRGINVYPCLLPSMQKLTARGISLAMRLRKVGVPVIESYPGAAQDIMRIPRKGAGVEWLKIGLQEFGINVDFKSKSVSHDELDAITSALVGVFHLAARSESLGSKDESPLIIPELTGTDRPLVIGVSGPIAAGKTTVSKILEQNGFAYTRFSLVIDEILAERGLAKNRSNRQAVGAQINKSGRQRELAERTLDRVEGHARIVVDGLRFPEDHAVFVEKFGKNFTHLYIEAAEDIRKARYCSQYSRNQVADERDFESAANSEVEKKVEELSRLANATLSNNGSKDDLERNLTALFESFKEEA